MEFQCFGMPDDIDLAAEELAELEAYTTEARVFEYLGVDAEEYFRSLHAAWDKVRDEFGDAATPVNPVANAFVRHVYPPRLNRNGYVEFTLTDDARRDLELDRGRAGELVEVNGRAIKAGKYGFTLVRSSALKEVSIVAIGADAGTSVSIAAPKGEEAFMSTASETTAEQIREEAAAETERINGVRRVCDGRFGDIEAKAIREGWDTQRTELEILRASRPTAPCIQTQHVAPTRDVIEAAILGSYGHENLAETHLGPQAAQQARDMRATSLVDLCRVALVVDGRDAPSGREALIRAALSTYSLPVALGNAANKVLLSSYTESPATWRSFAAIKSANDFKDHTGVRPSQIGDLEEVAPGGEIKHGSVKEATYQAKGE